VNCKQIVLTPSANHSFTICNAEVVLNLRVVAKPFLKLGDHIAVGHTHALRRHIIASVCLVTECFCKWQRS